MQYIRSCSSKEICSRFKYVDLSMYHRSGGEQSCGGENTYIDKWATKVEEPYC